MTHALVVLKQENYSTPEQANATLLYIQGDKINSTTAGKRANLTLTLTHGQQPERMTHALSVLKQEN